jgi:hypothetical protein
MVNFALSAVNHLFWKVGVDESLGLVQKRIIETKETFDA